MMQAFAVLILALFGLAAGSFLNSFVWRYGKKRPHPARSVCVHCRKTIQPRDLVPLVSFLLLAGKCRFCRKPIPWHYPVVEAVTALLFILPLFVFGLTVVLLPVVALTFFLALLFLLDVRYSLLPDSVSIPAMLAALLVSMLLGRTLSDVLLGVAIGAGLFLVQYVLSRGRWIGDGDIRLGAVMGLALGWKLTVVGLLVSYWSGAFVGALLLASRRKTLKSSLPFGAFLSSATYATLLFGETLLRLLQP